MQNLDGLAVAGSRARRVTLAGDIGYPLRVIRLLRVLAMALLLGPQVGTVLVPTEALCEESRDCCAPDEGCDVSCVVCACCPGRSLSSTPSVSLEPVDSQVGSSGPLAATVALPLLPTDILHVPKSA